jgi:hypothetical protein
VKNFAGINSDARKSWIQRVGGVQSDAQSRY